MKFDLHPPGLEETSADAQGSPEQPDRTLADELNDGGVRVRYGRAVDSALSSLARLRAHTRGRPSRDEPFGDDSSFFDGTDSREALFRPALFSGRTGGEQ